MLTQLKADNFKCLDGFELRLGRHALLLGLNGSGKSSVIDLLDALHRFLVEGAPASDCFPAPTVTRWGLPRPQAFELIVAAKGAHWWIDLTLERGEGDEVRIVREALRGPGLQLERRLESPLEVEIVIGSAAPQVVLVPDRISALALLLGGDPTLAWLPHQDEGTGTAFAAARAVLSGVRAYRPAPALMNSVAERPEGRLRSDGANFAAWMLGPGRHAPARKQAIEQRVREVLPGFQEFTFVPEGSRHRLMTIWSRALGSAEPAQSFHFGELSEGQRMICFLAALAELAHGEDATLALDEPDNFVALQEIQPLMLSLMSEPGLQLVVVSHHPGIIDLLAKDYGLVFEREAVGPARVRRWKAPDDAIETPSELVAAGEIDGGA